jgi:hypothetical protein
MRRLPSLAALALVLSLTAPVAAGDWAGFRGPRASGLSDERGLPLTWSDTENVAWKAKLPGPGASSPIVWGDRVFVTSYSGYGGSRQGDLARLKRHLVCVDRHRGSVLWTTEVPARLPELEWAMPIAQHGYATSTPVTDGERVYVYFGKSGVLAYDLSGKEKWRADVGDLLNEFGSGASPVIVGNLLIVNATVEGSRMVALDRTTGKPVWRVRLNGDTWTTPILVDIPGGKPELVLATRHRLYAYDPENGQELWRCEWTGADYPSPSPVARDGIIYAMGSSSRGRVVLALRAGGRGDVGQSHVVWKANVGASYCSPLLVGPHLYFFSGQAHCLRADTGAIVYQERLAGLGQEYSSPVAADGKIYLFTRRGDGYVLGTGPKLEVLARNTLTTDGGFVASPAIQGGQLFIRAGDVLFCLGAKKKS